MPLFVWGILLYSQVPATSYTLDRPVPSNQTKDWIASDFVNMIRRDVYNHFHARPDEENHVLAGIDPFFVEDPEEGNETGGPNQYDDGVVGAIQGKFGVAPNGSATYAIPIEAPPGISGMTPELSIVYNSMGDNGILGPGWSLAGISSISNVRPTPYYDDHWGLDYEHSYFNTDHFILDGQRLIEQGEGTNYLEGEYRLENDNFTRIRKLAWADGIYFTSETKGGLIYYYGGSPDSRQRVVTNHFPNRSVISYNVNLLSDRFGHEIEYDYETDASTGECYIKKISYGEGGEIIFIYENRKEPIISRLQHMGHNVEFQVKKKLIGINTNYDGITFRNYGFHYKERGTTAEEYLEEVTLEGAKGEHFNKTIISWTDIQQSSYDFQYFEGTFPGLEDHSGQPYSGDFNGDGLADICLLIDVHTNSGYHNDVVFYKNHGNNLFTKEFIIDGHPNHTEKQIFIGDFNGDGISDVLIGFREDLHDNYIADLFLFKTDFSYQAYWKVKETGLNPYLMTVGDFDGDGLSDILSSPGGCLYGTPDPNEPLVNRNYNMTLDYDHNFVFSDFNGNGRMDALKIGENGADHLLYINQIIDFDAPTIISQQELPCEPGSVIQVGDYNGDLISDLCIIYLNEFFSIYQSYGDGFVRTLENKHINAPDGGSSWDELTFQYFGADLNGDGRTDIVRSYYYVDTDHEATRGFRNLLVTNISGTDLIQIYDNPQANRTTHYRALSLVSDFNADGHSDLFYNRIIECKSRDAQDNCTKYWHSFSLDYTIDHLDEQFNCIKAITNGKGVELNIEYKHLFGEVRKKGETPVFPVAFTPGTLSVVKKVFTADPDFYSATNYEFEGARMHVGGKGFLGFLHHVNKQYLSYGQVLITETSNDIDNAYYYMWPETITKSVSDLLTTSLLSKTTNLFDNKSFYDDHGDRRRNYFAFLRKTLTQEYETDGSFIRVTRTDLSYDDIWCNLTSSHSMVDDDQGLNLSSPGSSFDFREINSNAYETMTPEMEEDWILGRLKTAFVKKVAPGTEDIPHTAIFEYYSNGLLKTETSQPWGDKWLKKEYIYDQWGNLIKSVTSGADIEIREYQTIYDENERFIESSINPLGHSDNKVYDQLTGDILTKNDPNGLNISIIYDGFGRIIETSNPDHTKTKNCIKWVDEDDPDAPPSVNGKPLPLYFKWVKSSGGAAFKTYFDKHDRELRSVRAGFNNQLIYTDTEYNLNSTLKKVSMPYFKGSPETEIQYVVYLYDEINRILKVTAPGDRVTETTYNGLSQSITNAAQQVNTKTHNAIGWLASTTDTMGYKNTYSYYSDGNIWTIQDPAGNKTKFEYDIYGNPTVIDDPDLGKNISDYYVDGTLKSETKANSSTSKFTYDLIGRLKTRAEQEGLTQWFYDENEYGLGKVSRIEGPFVSEHYTYDVLSRLIQKDETIGNECFSLKYTYDIYNRLKTTSYPSGFILRHYYNQNGYLAKVGAPQTGQTLWEIHEMNARDQQKHISLGSNLSSYYCYDVETGLVEEIETPGIQHMTYEWYTLANLKSRENKRISNLKETFYYDDLNRLVSVEKNGHEAQKMTYDKLGNITFKKGVGTYIYEGAQPHALSSISGEQIPISRSIQSISYTTFDKVKRIEEGESTLDISYGNAHERKKMVQTTEGEPSKTKFYVGGGLYEKVIEGGHEKLIHYLNTDNGLFAIYTEDTKWHTDQSTKEAAEPHTEKRVQFVFKDHLGSIQYVTDTDGILEEEFSYDAWGLRRDPINWENFEVPPTPGTDRGFTSHEHLDLFTLVNMNGRIYDPLVGRFLSADPYMQMPEHTQGLNRYSYCFNNPLSYTDPSGFFVTDGFFPLWAAVVVGTVATVATMGSAAPLAVAVIAGAAAGFASAVVSAALNGVSFGQAMVEGVKGGMLGATLGLVSYGVGSIFSELGSIVVKESGKLILEVENLIGHMTQAVTHGMLNGGIRVVMGGRFEHGMLSGFFASFAGSWVSSIANAPVELYAIIGAVVGGTAEALGGGKFANGAITGAFVGMFNHGLHQDKNLPTRDQISSALTSFSEKLRQHEFAQLRSETLHPSLWPENFNFNNYTVPNSKFGFRSSYPYYFDIYLSIGNETLIVTFRYQPANNSKRNYASNIKMVETRSSSQGVLEGLSHRYKIYLTYQYKHNKSHQVGTIFFRNYEDYTKYVNYVKPN